MTMGQLTLKLDITFNFVPQEVHKKKILIDSQSDNKKVQIRFCLFNPRYGIRKLI